MHTKLIGFTSPKTAGATTLALNTGILLAHQQAGQKVGVLQLSTYPDLDIYGGVPGNRNLADLKPFMKTDEWQPDLYKKIVHNNVVDIIQSPSAKGWESLDLPSFQSIWEMLVLAYDVLIVDVHHSLPNDIEDWVYDQLPQVIIVGTVDPVSLRAVGNLLESKSIRKPYFVLNQCSATSMSAIKHKIKHLKADFLGVLPLEEKHLWSQLYQGVPVVFAKRSKWTKSLLAMLDQPPFTA